MKYSARGQRPKTAVIYTRVSTEEQAEHGFSLAHQEDLLRRECARKGIQILEHFQDDGYSAKDFKRPAFQELIAYLKRHKKQVQYLLVTKWCRFSRDVANTILMNRELQAHGTRVVTLDDAEESDNPANFLLTMLNMTLPEIDNRILEYPGFGFGNHRYSFPKVHKVWDKSFERFDLVLSGGWTGGKEKIPSFDLPGKIDLSGWKISNRWIESSVSNYLTEIQWVRKRKKRKHCHF